MNKTDEYNRWRPHPWHGLDIGEGSPNIVNAYIELTPYDSVKYEIDKQSGYIKVDRPQKTSSQPPQLYGFIPKTLCDHRVCKLSPKAVKGDNDPLDICVISEKPINRTDIILKAKVIGGMQMVDNQEADDKIIAVLNNDYIYNKVNDIKEVPSILIERLHHYFMTYKLTFGETSTTSIEKIYGRSDAYKVIQASIDDYKSYFY